MDAETTVSTHSHVPSAGSDTTPFVLGSTVGRFVIRERLGIGGMGEVYRADDTQLKRTVAIKRLVNAAGDQFAAARLLKEAQRASALNHPRIASVYDVFTMGDELLLVMEFVDGMTLRERMKREMSVEDFCTIAVQCADALSAAHTSGILHGDLKPANIMLTSNGQVKVCDFGLARRLPKTEGAAETTTTTQHGLAGTPAYLAPEALLEHPLDERADLFSLGVVFYQMLTARNPFVADGVMATLDRVLHAIPDPIDRLNPHVPARLARTVHRMLEKDPRDRPASAKDVGEAISAIGGQLEQVRRRRRLVRRVQAGAAVTALVTLLVLVAPRLAIRPAPSTLPPLPQPINLIVLPFTATGGSEDRASFTEGLTESLTTQLSRLTLNRPFQVVTEADRRQRKIGTPLEARQQFGVNLALRGALEYSGQVVDVLASLVDTGSGKTLRSERFRIDNSDPIVVYTRTLEAATRMMNIEPDKQEQVRLDAGTVRPEAHDFYLQGRGYLLNDDRPESVDLAIKVFQTALKSDPKYTLAYAGLGEAYWRKYKLTSSPQWVPLARGACEGARAQDMSLAEPHICLAMVLNGTGEYEQAAASYRRALDRETTNDQAYTGLAEAYEKQGKHTDAEQTYLRAIQLRPHYWGGYYTLASYYYRDSRFKDARDMFQHVVDLAPDSFRGHNSLGACQFALDQIPEAIDQFKQSMTIRPNFNAASNLGTLYYFEGQPALAADYYRQALTFEQGRYEVWGNFAHTLETLGQKAEADEAFRKARQLVLDGLSVNSKNAALYVELADHNAALGDAVGARIALNHALMLSPEDGHTLFRLAAFYETRMKARDDALKWLTKAVERGQTWREIDRAPELRKLRADPRFQQLRNSQTRG
jgi:serine/threonine-protein kinase